MHPIAAPGQVRQGVAQIGVIIRRPVDRLGNALAVGIVAVGDAAKAKLVRSTPKTFKCLGLSQQTAFCPKKAMLAVLNHSEIKLNADTSRLKSSITTYCPFANSIHFPSP